jgi:hypothetical protein
LPHAEPFGPVDTIVLVDTEAEPLAAMNARNGALVRRWPATTSRRPAGRRRPGVHGRRQPTALRGDRAEVFGGKGRYASISAAAWW